MKTKSTTPNPNRVQLVDKDSRRRIDLCLCENCRQRRVATFIRTVSVFQAVHGPLNYSFVRKASEASALSDMEKSGGIYLSHQVFSGTYYIHLAEFSGTAQYTKPLPDLQTLSEMAIGWQSSSPLHTMGTGFMVSLVSASND